MNFLSRYVITIFCSSVLFVGATIVRCENANAEPTFKTESAQKKSGKAKKSKNAHKHKSKGKKTLAKNNKSSSVCAARTSAARAKTTKRVGKRDICNFPDAEPISPFA